MRKVLALILVSVMLLSLIVVGSSAATTILAVEHNDGTKADYLTEAQLAGFEFKDGDTLKITSGDFTGTLTIEVDDKNLTLTTANDSIVFAGKIVVKNSETFSSAIQEYGTLTIKDMQIKRNVTFSGDVLINVANTTNVVIDNVVALHQRTQNSSIVTMIKVSDAAPETNLTVNSSALIAGSRAVLANVVASTNITITSSALVAGNSHNAAITTFGEGDGEIVIKNTDVTASGCFIVEESCVSASLYFVNITTSKQIINTAPSSALLVYSINVTNTGNDTIQISDRYYDFSIPQNYSTVAAKSTAVVDLALQKDLASSAIVERGSSGTEAVKEVVSTACANVWAAFTNEEVAEIKSNAFYAIALIEAKDAAIEEINEATEDRTEDVVALGSSAIVAINSCATIEDVADVKSAALAAINLLKAKHDAQDAVDEAAGSFDPFKAYVKLVAPNIWNKNTIAEVKDAEQTILNGINLLKEKFVAIKGLEPDRENEDEVIVEIASKAINDIVNAETSSAVAEIVSKAIADIEFEVYTNNAQADVAAEAEGETDESIKDIESAAIAAIEDAATKAEIDEIKSQAIADIKLEKAKNAAQADVKAEADVENDEIKEIESNAIAAIEVAKTEEEIAGIKAEAIEAIKLVKAKIAAEAYINSSAALDTDERIKEIVSKAIADIWAQNKDADVEDVKSAAIAAILLAEDKVEAEEAVIAEAGETPSAEMQQIVENALGEIWAQLTRGGVANAKAVALQAIQNQKVKEAPVTADNAIWYVVVATVAILGSAVVTKKVFF